MTAPTRKELAALTPSQRVELFASQLQGLSHSMSQLQGLSHSMLLMADAFHRAIPALPAFVEAYGNAAYLRMKALRQQSQTDLTD